VPSLLGIRARPNQTPNRKCRGRPDTTAAQRADRAVGRLRHSARSSKPGGCDPVAARHAAAAPRWATRRDTAAPTPSEIDQIRASRQRTPRDAGFSGGSWRRLTRQRAVIPLRHAAAAAAPDANANPSHRRRCTPKSFPLTASGNPCRVRGGFQAPPWGSAAVCDGGRIARDLAARGRPRHNCRSEPVPRRTERPHRTSPGECRRARPNGTYAAPRPTPCTTRTAIPGDPRCPVPRLAAALSA
jgi:hypothetical protein